MSGDTRPVGMFDSGVGGLTVLAEITAQHPHESVIYVADQRWAPYGDRSLEEVRVRSAQVAGQLVDTGAKLVVVACNSASVAALHHLRDMYPGYPFVGIEPAVKPAALMSESRVIGVLATAATFQGKLFAGLVERHANGARVLMGAARGLADLVDDGLEDSNEAREILVEVLEPMVAERMDTLVLGCTHYPFLLNLIRTIVGDGVTIIDPAPAVARRVGSLLDEHSLRTTSTDSGVVGFHTTLDPDRLAIVIEGLTGKAPELAPTRW